MLCVGDEGKGVVTERPGVRDASYLLRMREDCTEGPIGARDRLLANGRVAGLKSAGSPHTLLGTGSSVPQSFLHRAAGPKEIPDSSFAKYVQTT